MLKIVNLRLRELQERLDDRKIELAVDDEAKHYLVSVGYSPTYGARPLNRAIQTELLNPLSVMILSEQVLPGETVKVHFDGPHNRLAIMPNHAGNQTEPMDVDWDDGDDDIEIEEIN